VPHGPHPLGNISQFHPGTGNPKALDLTRHEGRYVDKKIKMYGGHIDSLRTIHDCKCIAEIAARLVNNTLCMFSFLTGTRKLTLVAGCFNLWNSKLRTSQKPDRITSGLWQVLGTHKISK